MKTTKTYQEAGGVQLSSKSQIGLIETIMVTMVIMMIIIVGMIVYFKFFRERTEEISEEITVQRADVLLATISSMPELQCTIRSSERNCIDTAKLLAAKETFNDPYYTQMFGFKNIKVEKTYPAGIENECTLEKYTANEYSGNCNKWTLYERKQGDKIIISTPISLFFPTTKQYAIGRLTIET